MSRPQFLCIGAQKAGTTWLHENLRVQPGVWVPPVKEIHHLDHPAPKFSKRLRSENSHHRLARAHFWDRAGACLRGRASAREVSLAWHIAFASREGDWYERLFSWADEAVCGEICPGYARMTPDQIGVLKQRHPDLRIIYLLRDPIDRAWSSVAMHFRKTDDFQISQRNDQEILARLRAPKMLAHCAYADNIENWARVFPAEQLFFGFFERIVREPKTFLADILRHIAVDAQIDARSAGIPVNSGRGEQITPFVEHEIGCMLYPEAVYLHKRFANAFTARWLAHAQAALESRPYAAPNR